MQEVVSREEIIEDLEESLAESRRLASQFALYYFEATALSMPVLNTSAEECAVAISVA
jgi:hypothetical protein